MVRKNAKNDEKIIKIMQKLPMSKRIKKFFACGAQNKIKHTIGKSEPGINVVGHLGLELFHVMSGHFLSFSICGRPFCVAARNLPISAHRSRRSTKFHQVFHIF
jgi:hypothetical protein